LSSTRRSTSIPHVRPSRILAVVLGAAMGLIPLAPSEHAHEDEATGQPHVVVHRHLNPHGIQPHHQKQSTIDHDEDPILTLSAVYNVPPQPEIAGPILDVAEPIQPLVLSRNQGSFIDVEILIHGPPGAPTSLRAPPSFPTL
jgi:hypothetical protein